MDEFYQMVCSLPPWLKNPLLCIPEDLARQIHELRLRLNCCPCFTVNGRQYSASHWPILQKSLNGITINQNRLEECFYTLCGGSVHTHQEELSHGYFTLPGGHRVGVGGRYLSFRESGEITLQTLCSLNLRVARERSIFLPQEIQQILESHFIGLFIAGEPGSGKTTLLRQIALFLAEKNKIVAVIDEREEIFPISLHTVAHTQSPAVDVISGLNKHTAMTMALRSLAPQIIILDELGDMKETCLLEQGFFSGVDFIASIHARDKQEALQRPQIERLYQKQMLKVMVTLSGRETPGKIQEVNFF